MPWFRRCGDRPRTGRRERSWTCSIGLGIALGRAVCPAPSVSCLRPNGIFALSMAESPVVAVAAFGVEATISPSRAYFMDIGRRNSGSVSGGHEHGGELRRLCERECVPLPSSAHRQRRSALLGGCIAEPGGNRLVAADEAERVTDEESRMLVQCSNYEERR